MVSRRRCAVPLSDYVLLCLLSVGTTTALWSRLHATSDIVSALEDVQSPSTEWHATSGLLCGDYTLLHAVSLSEEVGLVLYASQSSGSLHVSAASLASPGGTPELSASATLAQGFTDDRDILVLGPNVALACWREVPVGFQNLDGDFRCSAITVAAGQEPVVGPTVHLGAANWRCPLAALNSTLALACCDFLDERVDCLALGLSDSSDDPPVELSTVTVLQGDTHDREMVAVGSERAVSCFGGLELQCVALGITPDTSMVVYGAAVVVEVEWSMVQISMPMVALIDGGGDVFVGVIYDLDDSLLHMSLMRLSAGSLDLTNVERMTVMEGNVSSRSVARLGDDLSVLCALRRSTTDPLHGGSLLCRALRLIVNPLAGGEVVASAADVVTSAASNGFALTPLGERAALLCYEDRIGDSGKVFCRGMHVLDDGTLALGQPAMSYPADTTCRLALGFGESGAMSCNIPDENPDMQCVAFAVDFVSTTMPWVATTTSTLQARTVSLINSPSPSDIPSVDVDEISTLPAGTQQQIAQDSDITFGELSTTAYRYSSSTVTSTSTSYAGFLKTVITGTLMLSVDGAAAFVADARVWSALRAGIAAGLPGVEGPMVSIEAVANQAERRLVEGQVGVRYVLSVPGEPEDLTEDLTADSVVDLEDALLQEINRELSDAGLEASVLGVDVLEPSVEVLGSRLAGVDNSATSTPSAGDAATAEVVGAGPVGDAEAPEAIAENLAANLRPTDSPRATTSAGPTYCPRGVEDCSEVSHCHRSWPLKLPMVVAAGLFGRG